MLILAIPFSWSFLIELAWALSSSAFLTCYVVNRFFRFTRFFLFTVWYRPSWRCCSQRTRYQGQGLPLCKILRSIRCLESELHSSKSILPDEACPSYSFAYQIQKSQPTSVSILLPHCEKHHTPGAVHLAELALVLTSAQWRTSWDDPHMKRYWTRETQASFSHFAAILSCWCCPSICQTFNQPFSPPRSFCRGYSGWNQ